MKRALTIAASDSSATAGVQSDLKVFSRCGVYGVCAVTLLAAQDTYAVRRVFRPAASIVGAQIDAVLRDIGADACKIGWYRSPELTTVIAGRVRRRDVKPVVLDPCLWSERGEVLTPPRTLKRMVRELLPTATVLTVTLRELGVLAGSTPENEAELQAALERTRGLGPECLVLEDAPGPEGPQVLLHTAATSERLAPVPAVPAVAGAGSLFSAALTAALARGEDVAAAARSAAEFLIEATAGAVALGKGAPVMRATCHTVAEDTARDR